VLLSHTRGLSTNRKHKSQPPRWHIHIHTYTHAPYFVSQSANVIQPPAPELAPLSPHPGETGGQVGSHTYTHTHIHTCTISCSSVNVVLSRPRYVAQQTDLTMFAHIHTYTHTYMQHILYLGLRMAPHHTYTITPRSIWRVKLKKNQGALQSRIERWVWDRCDIVVGSSLWAHVVILSQKQYSHRTHIHPTTNSQLLYILTERSATGFFMFTTRSAKVFFGIPFHTELTFPPPRIHNDFISLPRGARHFFQIFTARSAAV
jgi:hypothetical protein